MAEGGVTLTDDGSLPVDGDANQAMRRMARGGLWSLMAYVSTSGSAFLISLLLGRSLELEAFGRTNYYLFLLRLTPGLVALGVPAALSRLVAEYDGAGRGDQVKATWRLSKRFHLLVLPVLLVVTGLLLAGHTENLGLAVVLLVGVTVSLFLLDCESLLTGLRHFRVLGIYSALSGLVQLAVVAGGVALGFSWSQLLAGMVAGLVGGLWVLALFCRRGLEDLPPAAFDHGERSRFIRLSGMLALTFLIENLIFGRPEMLFLDWFGSDRDLGLYAAALRVASLAAVLPMVAGRAVIPEFSNMLGAGVRDHLAEVYPRVCSLLAVTVAPVALVGMGVGPGVVTMLYGSSYRGAGTVASLLLGGSLVSALAVPSSAAVLTGPRPRLVAEVGFAVAVVNVTLDIVLIRQHGILGAAIATTIAQFLAVAVGIVYGWRRLGLSYPVMTLARVVVFGTTGGVVARSLVDGIGGLGGVTVGGLAGLALYGVLVVATQTVDVGELLALARGDVDRQR